MGKLLSQQGYVSSRAKRRVASPLSSCPADLVFLYDSFPDMHAGLSAA